MVFTYWSLNNALIQTYTLPYLRQIRKYLPQGSKIYLLTINENRDWVKNEAKTIALLAKENVIVTGFVYDKFGFKMILKLTFMIPYLSVFCFIKKIRVLHAWCTPGGAIAWPVSLFTGKPLVFDSFEPHAESMLETGAWSRNSMSYRILFTLEKLQLKRAKEVICTTESMILHSQEVYKIKKQRYFVKPACVDLELFNPERAYELLPDLNLKNRVCVYAGKFGDFYLEEEVFDFFNTAYKHWQGNFSLILLTPHSDEEIRRYCEHSGFPFSAIVKKFVLHTEVPRYMHLANFGICTIRPVPSKRYGTPIKNGEYWAMGLPVIIPKNISDDSGIIANNKIGYVLNEFSESEYKKALLQLDDLFKENGLQKRIRAVAEKTRNFRQAEVLYSVIYATH